MAFTGFTLLLFLVLIEVSLHVLAAVQGPQRHADADSLPPPDPAAFRVIAIGDSWVYGAESEPHEAFIEVFKRAAAEDLGRSVQVINLGQSATNSSQALVALSRSIDVIEPDLVVALTGANNLLHDKAVRDAAQVMGEDARMVPGLSALSALRTVRLARILWVSLLAPPDPLGTSADTPSGTAGLPEAPPEHTTPVVRLPWWDLTQSRRWADALILLEAAELPSDDPRMVGVKSAWEGLLRAHLEQFAAAEALAARALEAGGDDATAHEARAVIASRQGRPLHAMQHRARAALASGHPWVRERARGLVLIELEALEAARRWLISVQRATPGDLETLTALARLPQAVRTQEVDDLLFAGPRGLVTPIEYFDYHLASSGLVDRATAALGDRDPDESVALRLTRARAAELQGDPGALAAFGALVPQATKPRDLDRARAGVLRLGSGARAVSAALGTTPEALLVQAGPETSLALVEWFGRVNDCDRVLSAAVRAVDGGALPQSLERVQGACVTAEDAWAIGDMGTAREVVLDRAALIGGTVDEAIPAPSSPAWPAIRDRDFAAVPADAPVEWRALAHALAGEPRLAQAVIKEHAARARDRAVLDLAEGLALRAEGRELDALVALARAADGRPTDDPWARLAARGLGAASAQRWTEAQEYLLSALTAAPGQLEILQALAAVPDTARRPGTNLALGYAPAGRVAVDQWVDWYLAASRETAAELALRWSWSRSPTSSDAIRRAIAEARVHVARGALDAARARLAAALTQLDAAASIEPSLRCEALTLRLRIGGRGTAAGEIADVLEMCPRYAPAWAAAAYARVGAVSCEDTAEAIHAAIDRGLDPDLVLDWMPKCVSRARLLGWAEARMGDAPELARAWTKDRIQPPQPDAVTVPGDDILVRQLAAMHRLSGRSGAAFVALTYPFPSGHHARVRDLVLAAGARDVPVLDLYGAFDARYDPAAWRALRTPEDHVNADGYALMGELLHGWARGAGLLAR